MQAQQAIDAANQIKYQRAVAQQKEAEQLAKAQFQQDSIDYRQREAALTRNIADLKTKLAGARTKQEADALYDAHGNGLRQQYGLRSMSPDWLRANVPPARATTAVRARRARARTRKASASSRANWKRF